ncbi:hypothetical protein [Thalassotalea sp. G2M2-11]|uniref:hypothetical protein n=1 Tax=Thalassotalea sp. G2M2-11 TaxID=2787627 RepID=UPI0019D1FBE1|nr:hypothetical protein [Thalassotalea sp. G2M2-11]
MVSTLSNTGIKSTETWLASALLSLLLANVLAILLILLKIPFFPFGSAHTLFKGVLAYHVNLAMVFWVPMAACWYWRKLFQLNNFKGKLALCLSGLAFIFLALSLMDIQNDISLSNYYPILHSDIFILSLILQVVSVSILALEVICCSDNKQAKLFLAKSAAFVWLILVFSIIGNLLVVDVNYSSDGSFEKLLWAPGHIQQTMNSLLIAAMWSYFLNCEKVLPILRLSSWVAGGTCIIALCIQYFSADELIKRQVFTWQMTLFSWWPMAAVAWQVLKEKLSNLYLGFSLSVAAMGMLVGMIIVPGTLSIPGHYHGMTGAFNLAFFAILLKNKLNAYSEKLTLLYAGGIILLIIGLSWAGSLGIGRKLVAEQQGILTVWQGSAIALIVLGAVIAIATSILIVKSFFPRTVRRM